MATGSFTIILRPEWREQEGDGSKCCNCEDHAWLTQWRLVVVDVKDEQTCMTTEFVLCGSCGDHERRHDFSF